MARWRFRCASPEPGLPSPAWEGGRHPSGRFLRVLRPAAPAGPAAQGWSGRRPPAKRPEQRAGARPSPTAAAAARPARQRAGSAAPYLKNDARLQTWQTLYDRAAQSLNGEDLQRILDRTAIRNKA